MAAAKLADAGVALGSIIADKYRVDSIIGVGGMGVVAQGTHIVLGERVAIKMLRQDIVLDHDVYERFVREAQAAAKLKSEYVARVTDVGYLENGSPWMVMEYLAGNDLEHRIGELGRLPVPWAVQLTLQVAEALSEAHANGIVHRDIKPTNLFITNRPDGTSMVKVLDFGISKTLIGTDLKLTQTQSMLGTPAYMSPEQMRSARLVDTRTDIWSLGTVLYEAIEGHRPFVADSFSEMVVKVTLEAPDPMTHAPAALQHVIMRCLQKSPDQRYASMAELGAELAPFAQDPQQAQILVTRMQRLTARTSGIAHSSAASSSIGMPRATPVPMQVPMQSMSESAAMASAPHTLPQSSPPRRMMWIGLAALLTGGVGIGLYAGLAHDDAPSPAPAPTPAISAPAANTDTATTPNPIAAPVDAAPPAIATSPDAGSAEEMATTTNESASNKANTTNPTNTTRPKGQHGHPSGGTGKRGTGTNTGANSGTGTGTGTGSGATPMTVAQPPKVEEPVKPKCDPFKDLHGCKQ